MLSTRRIAIAATIGLLVQSLVGSGLASAAGGTPAQDEAGALAAAHTGGQRVELLGRRTETGQVFANPDGTFTLQEHLRPHWVKRSNGVWVDADPTLRRSPDGTVSPVATTVSMTFSGGGHAPMATMSSAAGTMSLTWPAALPVPVLDGNVATYPEILPGVDLRIVADVDRFTHIFVIKSRAAARSPAVRRLTVGIDLGGLRLRPGAGQALEAVDASGTAVFRGLSPLMWDSTDKVAAARGIATDPKQAPVAATLSGGSLVLEPDPAMLDDPKTPFPLYIDPEWTPVSGPKSHWSVLRQSDPSTSYYDRSSIASSDSTYGMMRAGFNDFEGPTYRDRSVWQMNISAVRYMHINTAKFVLTQQWSGAACTDGTKRWTDLRHLNSTFSSSTTWNTSWNSNGSGWGATLSSSAAIKRAGYSCKPDRVEFPVTAQVAADAAVGSNFLWVGLRARSETDKYSWKRYKNDAFVEITYNRYPNAPAPVAGAATDGKPCATGTSRPWVTTGTPTLAAKHSDADNGQATLTTRFYWWPLGGTRPADTATTGVKDYPGSNGANATPTLPAGQVLDSTTYVWQARTFDGIDWGQFSAPCEFTADTDPPNKPSSVTAGFYNASTSTGGPGIADTFTFNPPATGANEVTGYIYALDGGINPAAGVSVDTVDPNTFVGTASIAPTHDGTTALNVWTKDRAGRPSDGYVTFTMQVSPGGLAAEYTFEGASPTADVTNHGNNLASLPAGATIVDGRTSSAADPNKALSLNGSGYAETASSPLESVANGSPVNVRTDANFTVSAWVRISSAGTVDQTAVAINGTNTAAFVLGYGSENKWVFRMAESDLATPQVRSAVSSAAPTTNKWTHLAGTYDATTKKLTLYVGGVAQPTTATLTTGFNATKKLSIGAQSIGTTHPKPLTGAIDDVRFYNSIVNPVEIQRLAAPRKPVVTVLSAVPVPVGTGPQVKFDSLGDTNVTVFRHSLNFPLPNLTNNAVGGAYTHTYPAVTTASTQTIRARAQDANNLQSDLVTVTVQSIASTVSLTGVITDAAGNPIPGAAVSLNPGGLTTTSAANGSYSFTGFTAGTYTVSAVAGNRCAVTGNTDVAVNGATTVNLALVAQVRDAFGYSCGDGTGGYTNATTLLPISGDEGITQVSLPFTMPFYGQPTTAVWVDVNGLVLAANQTHPHADDAAALPNPSAPNSVIAPYWADLEIDSSSGVYTLASGSAPNRSFTIEWRNVFPHGDPAHRFGFETVLRENGAISFAYTGIGDPVEAGANAVVGIESQGGYAGLTYLADEAALISGGSVTYSYPTNPGTLPSATISGTVTAGGAAAAGTVVILDPIGLSTVTDATGSYRFDALADGAYHITAQTCAESASADVTIAGGSVVSNLAIAQGLDAFGYVCSVASAPWIPADTTVLPLSGDDQRIPVTLPFAVPFYGQSISNVWVETNGIVYFTQPVGTYPDNPALPTAEPTGFVAPLWDDLVIGATGSVRTTTIGTAPNRQVVLEWRNASFFTDSTTFVSFEVLLSENGKVTFNYLGLTNDLGRGAAATVGIEGTDGTSYLSYLHDEPKLLDGEAVTFTYPGTQGVGLATLSGAVTVGGAGVAAPLTVLLAPSGLRTVTDTLGRYQFVGLMPGTYTVTAYHCGRSAASAPTAVNTDVTVPTLNIAAATGSSGNYSCAENTAAFVPGDTQVVLSGDDVGVTVTTPFPITVYGTTSSTLWLSSNGTAHPADPGTWVPDRTAFPDAAAPNSVVAPFWDDLMLTGSASIFTKTTGTAPNRQFVVEWRDPSFWSDSTSHVTFEVVFSENGQISYRYGTSSNPLAQGSTACVGLENATGTVGFTYGCSVPVLVSGRAITFTPVA
ncbi:MAG TPA: LamG-like jellyroll fold domain-containing protein [Micromonosporaceae bacterium]|nr:LamG-like jellyroll fold domain-containing protein [Micromonosporaceae bacterium]